MMTKKEFDREKRALMERHEKEFRELAGRFAAENNPYKAGDIIRDHHGKARIKGVVGIYNVGGYYYCIYGCESLTRSGGVNKNDPERRIFQTNIIK